MIYWVYVLCFKYLLGVWRFIVQALTLHAPFLFFSTIGVVVLHFFGLGQTIMEWYCLSGSYFLGLVFVMLGIVYVGFILSF